MISLILVPLGAVVFLKLNKFYQFLVLSLSALLPFSFGDFKSIPSLLFIEWLPLVTFISLINYLNPVNSIEKKVRKIRFKGIEIFISALIILIIWTAVSIINNEILTVTRLTGEQTGTRRTYFIIFNNILLFFTVILFLSAYYKQIEFEKFFKIVLYISLIIGTFRILTYYLGINMPLIAGGFNYGEARTMAGETVLRFGGLTDVVAIGIPALFSYYVIKNKFNIVAFLLLFLFLFLSGGRTVMIGTILAYSYFLFFFHD